MIDKDIIQENKELAKRNSCTRTGISNVQSREDADCRTRPREARECARHILLGTSRTVQKCKTDRKEEKLCFAESEKMTHAGVEAGSHIVERHMAFDQKISRARFAGHEVPSHKIIKTPAQIEGSVRAAKTEWQSLIMWRSTSERNYHGGDRPVGIRLYDKARRDSGTVKL